MLPADHATSSYLTDGNTLRSWLATHDHKRIAILYALAITFFFFLGGIAAALIRLELATPAGDVMSADTYNKTFTFHGVVMVWFFLIPSIPTTLGNFLLPIMVGATLQHLPNGWMFGGRGGGWEFPAFWTVAMVVQAGLGAGAWALDAKRLLGRQPREANA